MKAKKVVPVPYAVVETDNRTFRVYSDGRVLWDPWVDEDFEHYPQWEDDYDEVLAAGLEVLK